MYDSSKLANHYWLRYKQAGACSELKGRVCVMVTLVSSPSAPWYENDRRNLWDTIYSGQDMLQEQARRYGTELEIILRELRMDVPAGQERNFRQYIPGFFHRNTLAEAQQYYKQSLDCDEVAIVFAINTDGRSYAQNDKNGDAWLFDEMSVLLRPFCPGLFIHELLHQFGAQDYYFPDWLLARATKYAPRSVMLSSACAEVDEVSAYLIGWTNEIGLKSAKFLEDTLCITEESHRRALEEEWKKKVY